MKGLDVKIMLNPLIVIGCGGSGVKTVQLLRTGLQRILDESGWTGPFPQAWQLIGVDMGVQRPLDVAPIPESDYLDIWQTRKYKDVYDTLKSAFTQDSSGFREYLGWMPQPSQIQHIFDDPTQFRAQGRVYGLAAMETLIVPRLESAIDAIKKSASEFRQIIDVLKWGGSGAVGPVQEPYVVVVGSMAGGTGSGIMLDIHEVVQRLSLHFRQISLIYSHSVFEQFSVGSQALQSNSLSCMTEMLNFAWDEKRKSSHLISNVQESEYMNNPLMCVVESQNKEKFTVATSPNESFQLVASWLKELATSEVLQDQMIRQLTNQHIYSRMNKSGFGFKNALSSDPTSVIYSLGYSVLSIGRDRFPEYATKLLQRDVISFLDFNFSPAGIKDSVDFPNSSQSSSHIRRLADGYLQVFLSEIGFASSEDLEKLLMGLIGPVSNSSDLGARVLAELEVARIRQTSTTFSSAESFLTLIDEVTKLCFEEQAVNCKQRIDAWTLELVGLLAKTLSRDIPRIYIPTAHAVLKITQHFTEQTVSQIRMKGVLGTQNALQMKNEAILTLKTEKKWRRRYRKSTENDLRAAATKSVLTEIQARIYELVASELEKFSHNEVENLVRDLEHVDWGLQHRSFETYGWPRIDETVPAEFRPPAFEVCLEAPETWSESLKRLIVSPQEIDGNRSGDPMSFARSSIIHGGYALREGGIAPSMVDVFVDTDRVHNQKFGESAIRIEIDTRNLEKRITSWLERPGSEFADFVREGMGDYLTDRSNFTGKELNGVDYELRLKKFAECLQTVLSQCQPLIQVDETMSAEMNLQWQPIVNFQLPFGSGHPAFEASLPILKASLPYLNDFDFASSRFFSSNSTTTSVCFNSFLKYAVNLTTLKRFCESQANFMGRVRTVVESVSAFNWRRTRKLSEFVPLPPELRHAAIRGFAICRMLGYITINMDEAVKISGVDREYTFPSRLLTPSEPKNLLPALLESMPLCFADIPRMGQEAFGAYRELISMGLDATPHGTGYVNECLRFLDSGERLRVPVDFERAEQMNADTFEERRQKMSKYLEMNLIRYQDLDMSFNAMLNPESLPPADKLTIELLDELVAEYSHVLETIQESRDNFDF